MGHYSRLTPSCSVSYTSSLDLIRRSRGTGTDARQARASLIDQNTPFLQSLARRYASKNTPYPDAIQEASLLLLSSIDTFREESGANIRTYTRPRIRGHLIDLARAPVSTMSLDTDNGDDPMDEFADPRANAGFESIEGHDMRHAVRSFIQGLTPREQSVLLRHVIEGESLALIGRELGVSRERARQIFHSVCLKGQAVLGPHYAALG